MNILRLILCMVLVACSATPTADMSPSDAMTEVDPVTYEKINVDKPILNIYEFQIKSLSNKNYKLIDLYFENNTKDWLRIARAQIVNIPGVNDYQIVVGDDLTTLYKSIAIELQLNNNSLVKLLKIPKEKRSKKEINRINELQKMPNISLLENYKYEDHLYSKISIPAGLKTRKWFVVFLKNEEKMSQFDIEVNFLDGTRKVFRSEVLK